MRGSSEIGPSAGPSGTALFCCDGGVTHQDSSQILDNIDRGFQRIEGLGIAMPFVSGVVSGKIDKSATL